MALQAKAMIPQAQCFQEPSASRWRRGRQLEVSLWLENKGLPPESPKNTGILAVSTWGCGPTSVPLRVVTVTWKRPTGVTASSPLLLGSSDTAFSVLSFPSLSGSCKHAHLPRSHTHGSSTGSHTQKTTWVPHCRLN